MALKGEAVKMKYADFDCREISNRNNSKDQLSNEKLKNCYSAIDNIQESSTIYRIESGAEVDNDKINLERAFPYRKELQWLDKTNKANLKLQKSSNASRTNVKEKRGLNQFKDFCRRSSSKSNYAPVA